MLTPIPVYNAQAKPKPTLKVTVFTVAPSGRLPRHLPTSSDMDERLILTCIMGDLAAIPVVNTHLYCFVLTLSQTLTLSLTSMLVDTHRLPVIALVLISIGSRNYI